MADSRTPVISNTTPLINLVGVGLLDLLPGLYGEVTIAEVVRDEYLAGRRPNDPELNGLPWLEIAASPTVDLSLPAQLGAGEAATLRLSIRLEARAVILDEAYGRRLAIRLGLPVVGTLGVLLAAKQSGMLPAVAPVVDQMINQGRRISAELRAKVLRAAGEQP